MCTVSWQSTPDGYELWFNRDELRTRVEALPPRLSESRPRTIAPLDPAGGGTWLAVNEAGVTVGILNYYQGRHHRPSGAPLGGEAACGGGASDPAAPSESGTAAPPSRGGIVTDLAGCSDFDEAARALAEVDPRIYNPFHVFIVGPDGRALGRLWDGVEPRSPAPVAPPLVSSSVKTEEVTSYRKSAYRWSPEAFHRSIAGPSRAHSVLMEREDAATMSISRVVVDARWVSFHYAPRDEGYRFGDAVRIARR